MTIPVIRDKNNNEYNFFEPLTKGGMGLIYKGKNLSLNDEVVLKLVKNIFKENSEKQKREADIAKRLNHKNVVETIDTGNITIGGTDYYYILMKFYPKGSVDVEKTSKMPLNDCYNLMMDILDGMEEIHKIAVHRDLKPQNILIDDDNHLRITDFGIAKYVEDKTKTNTFKGSGTLPYMSPECWKDEKNTPKMDIYALGIIFYQMLTAKLPYNIKSNMTDSDWRSVSLFSPLNSILKERSDISVQFDQMLQKMTNKRPDKRYDSISDIKATLQKIIATDKQNVPAYVENIVSMANETVRTKTEQGLKEEKKQAQEKEYLYFLRYHILELTKEIKDAVVLANSKLEISKIIVSETDFTDSTNYRITFSFMNNSVDIEFWDYLLINKYENEQKEINKRNQMQMYGTPFQVWPYRPSFLVNKNVSLIGTVKTNIRDGLFKESFNLLLEKPKDVDYGTWYIFQVSKNITPPEPKFGIDKCDFLRIYEQYQASPLHTCNYELYDVKKIMELITLMVQLC